VRAAPKVQRAVVQGSVVVVAVRSVGVVVDVVEVIRLLGVVVLIDVVVDVVVVLSAIQSPIPSHIPVAQDVPAVTN